MFHGVKPAGQPRTVRTLAESRANPENFPTDLPYNTQAGMPSGMKGGSGTYSDLAEGVTRGALPRVNCPKPFVIRS